MSRIGKRPITIPNGVDVQYQERTLRVKGPKGENTFSVPELVDLEVANGEISVKADFLKNSSARSMMGTVQSCLSNMVTGVAEGFTRKLTMKGVGYRAQVQGQNMELALGYSHPISYTLPAGVKAEMEGNTVIILSSHDKVLLGQTAANIRAFRPPEPYQEKGVRYEDETVRRKAGKTGKK